MLIRIDNAVVAAIVFGGVVVCLALWLGRSVRIAAGKVHVETDADSADNSPFKGGE